MGRRSAGHSVGNFSCLLTAESRRHGGVAVAAILRDEAGELCQLSTGS